MTAQQQPDYEPVREPGFDPCPGHGWPKAPRDVFMVGDAAWCARCGGTVPHPLKEKTR